LWTIGFFGFGLTFGFGFGFTLTGGFAAGGFAAGGFGATTGGVTGTVTETGGGVTVVGGPQSPFNVTVVRKLVSPRRTTTSTTPFVAPGNVAGVTTSAA
jgi:hypothetical protein